MHLLTMFEKLLEAHYEYDFTSSPPAKLRGRYEKIIEMICLSGPLLNLPRSSPPDPAPLKLAVSTSNPQPCSEKFMHGKWLRLASATPVSSATLSRNSGVSLVTIKSCLLFLDVC